MQSACKADFFPCKMAAVCGENDRGRRGAVCGDWTGKNNFFFYQKIDRTKEVINIDKAEDLKKLNELKNL